MKKSLVLAMAMALGVTASAYAANPFSDVPAGHWAYDSINKLAAAGVIEGYGDSTFGGDKLMTRYEMAQIVAKAMAKGANVDKLAAEFADELDNLGVRVANLEKKADNVKIAGQIRAHYQDNNNGKAAVSKLRTRLFVNGAINDDWSYTGRLQNEQVLTHDNAGNEDTKLNWAFVDGKIGGMAVTAGRQDFKLHTGSVVDATFDGVKVAYGKDVKLTGYAGKASNFTDVSGDRFYAADISAKVGVFDVYGTYYKIDAEYANNAEEKNADGNGTGVYKVADNYPALDQDIFVLGVGTKLAKDLSLTAEWLHGDADDYDGDKDGYTVGLKYRGAKAAKAGSWGLYANYFDQPQVTFVKHTITGYTDLPVWGVAVDKDEIKDYADGFKGFEVGANYTLAKNIVAGVKYYDLEAREGEAKDVRTLWSEVVFTF